LFSVKQFEYYDILVNATEVILDKKIEPPIYYNV